VTAFGSIQVSIPLSSIQEQQQLAAKNVELAKGIDQIKTQAMQDMARLRFYEAELAAAEIRTKFYHDQADWLKQRIEEGYSEMEKLWTVGGKLNDEKAAVERIGMLAATQQHKLAQYAGECWQELLAYLEEKAKLPAL
jgi:ribosomal protein L22